MSRSTTFAEMAARRDQGVAWIVRIEGVGSGALGWWAFCTEIPTYAGTNYFRWLREYPNPIGERPDPLGGAPESGSIELDILDVTNSLTSLFRFDAVPSTQLAEDLDDSETSIDVGSVSWAAALGGTIWVGNEAITYATYSGTTLTGCTRGAFGTDPAAHYTSDGVFSYLPYLKTRRISVYVAPLDGTSSSTEQLVGTFRVDGYGLSHDLDGWIITAASQTAYTSRLVDGRPVGTLSVTNVMNQIVVYGSQPQSRSIAPWDFFNTWGDAPAYGHVIVDDKELVGVSTSAGQYASLQFDDRALAGTEHVGSPPFGAKLTPVVYCDADYNGGIRFSPASSLSEDRDTGAWTLSSHFIDILLCRLTSSARANDGRELVNHDGSSGNWSSLPVGFGIGMPASSINFAQFLAVKDRTPGYLFPWLTLGDGDAQSFARWATTNFLGPIGCYLTHDNGQLGIVLPRMPMATDTVTSWGADQILQGTFRARIAAEQHIGSVSYKLRNDRTERFASIDYPALFGQGGYYGQDDKPLEFEVPGVGRDREFLARIAMRRLVRFARPVWRIELETDLSQVAVVPGSLVSLTHADMPDLEAGTRGVSGMLCEVLEKELFVSPGGVGYRWVLLGYGRSLRAARVSHSARITSSVSSGGNRVVTVEANRFTVPDNYAGWPESDAACFSASDVVYEQTPAGVRVGSSRTVVSTGANQITLNGTTAVTGGNNIVAADYDAAVARQQTRYAWLAGSASRTIGASSVRPNQYGEG